MKRDLKFREAMKNQILNAKTSDQFVDELFKPEYESIFNGTSEFSKKMAPEFYKKINKCDSSEKDKYTFEWKRLSTFSSSTNIIKDRKKDLIEDIKSENISIPHFASTLEYLLKNKDRLFRLLGNSKISPNGLINLNVFIHGEMVEICLDDYFVMSNVKESNNSENAFMKLNPSTNNLWALILEKAYAKLSGSYENCSNGDFISTLQLFSPAYTENLKHSNIKKLYNEFEKIKNALDSNYDVYCDIKLPKDSKEYEKLSKMGLITTHAYSVVDYYEMTDKLNNKIPLLKIKNLWGVNEWEGDWSDNSNKWTDDLRKLLNHENKQDGIFWIAYNDYVNFYTNTYIIYESECMNLFSEKLNFDKTKPLNLVKIKVSKDTKKANIVINQKSKYLYKVRKGVENFENNYCSMIVYKKTGGNEIECLGSDSGKKDRLLVELNDVYKGDYYVAINLPFKQSHYVNKNLSNLSLFDNTYNPTLTISVLSDSKNIEIQDIPENKEDIVEFYNNYVGFDSYSRNENKYSFEEEGEPESYRICHLDNKSAYGYIYYQNNSNASINEVLSFNELLNISLIPLLKEGNLNELNEEIMLTEDPNLANQLNLLKGKTNLDSKFEIIKDCNMNEPISKKNEFKIMITIAPNTCGTILFEKLDESSKINFESDISLTYPLEIILVKDEKFNVSKSKINYQGKQVDVYESIIEHNQGVVIRYRNRTKNLIFGSFLKFSDMKNLKIRLTSDNLIDESSIDNFFDYEIADKDTECYLCVKPDEFKYISLEAINIFEPFSYNLKCTYMINKSTLKDL